MSGIRLVSLPTASVAGEIQGQVIIMTTSGESIKLGSVEVFAYTRSEVEEAIKKVDEKLKAGREAIRLGNEQIDNIAERASEARKTASGNKAQQISKLEDEALKMQVLFRREKNYRLSSQPYFAELPSPVARAKTDGDGNFAIDVPSFGNFVIGARALHGEEHYAWLVPTNHAGSQKKLTLSNDNLTSAGGENSLLKTEGDEDNAEYVSREQAMAALEKLLRLAQQAMPEEAASFFPIAPVPPVRAAPVPAAPISFKAINGKEYKNVTVSRVEPDGIVVSSKSGISKVYFTELPKEVQERFGYNAAKVAEQAAEFQKQQEGAERERQEKGKNVDADLARAAEQF